MPEFHEANFIWPHKDASDVIVTGTFDNWSSSVHLTKGTNGFEASVKVPWGEKVLYKFVVDGRWATTDRHSTERDWRGNLNNVYYAPPRPAPPSGFEEQPVITTPAAFGVAPGPAAFRPSSNVTTQAASTAASTVKGLAGTVQAGVSSVVQAAQSFAESLIDQSAVTPAAATPAIETNGSAGPLYKAQEIASAVREATAAKAADTVEAAKVVAPEVTTTVEEATDKGNAKAAELPSATDIPAKAADMAEKAKATVVDALPEPAKAVVAPEIKPSPTPEEPKAGETPIPTPALAATPPTLAPEVPIPILPVADAKTNSAPGEPTTSAPETTIVSGASVVAGSAKLDSAAVPAEEPSTHVPLKPITSHCTNPATLPVSTAGAPAIPVNAPDVVAAPIEIPAAPAASESAALTTAAEPEAPKALEAVTAEKEDPLPEVGPAEKATPAPEAIAPEKAAAPATPPAADTAKTNGRAEPPRSLPPATTNGTNGTSAAHGANGTNGTNGTNGPTTPPAMPVTPTKSFLKSAPDTPGSAKSTTSSRFGTGSLRRSRTSFLGKIKEIFHHDHHENGEKEKKKEGRRSRQSASTSTSG